MKHVSACLVASRSLALLVSGVVLVGCGSITTDDLFGNATSGGEGGDTPTSTSTGTPSSASQTASSSAGTGGFGTTSSVGTGGVGGAGASGGAGPGGMGGNGAGGNGVGGGVGGAPPGCGNGVIDGNEQCDGALLGGHDCTEQGFSNPGGVTCNADCTLNTEGCQAVCDGQQREPGEACDGAHLDGHTCTEFGYANGNGLSCTACQLDASTCTAHCHNGLKEPGEACDNNDLGGADCTMFGYVKAGGLHCNGSCTMLDTSQCDATCGNGTREPGETCDGADLGGKTCVDFGFVAADGLKCSNSCVLDTSSCAAKCGNHVVEPGEQCDDGGTADGDGCSAKCKFEGTTCATAIPITLTPGTQTFTNTTVGGGSHSASGSSCPSASTDRVYTFTTMTQGFVTANLPRSATAFNSSLYVTTSCSDSAAMTPILCADSRDPAGVLDLKGGEVVSFRAIAGVTYFLFVDAGAAFGNYQLNVNFATGASCNDPIIFPLEPGTPMTAIGFTSNDVTYTTAGSCGGDSGPDVVYQLKRTQPATQVKVSLDAGGTTFNSVLYHRTQCGDGGSQTACSNVGGNGGEGITIAGSAASTGSNFIWVDGTQQNGGPNQGNYTMILAP